METIGPCSRSPGEATAGLAELALRIVFALVVIAAAITGGVLLAAPEETARTFSWGLAPVPLASLIAGLYLASAVAFAFAVRRPWPQTRGLALGVLTWTLPTLAITLAHLDQFDFRRFQAVAWIVSFVGTPLVTTAIVIANERRGEGEARESELPGWVRIGLGLLTLAGLVWGVALWINPRSFGEPLPFDLPPLGGRFLGCWAVLSAAMAVYALGRNRWNEARLSFIALLALFIGALIGALRSLSQTDPAGRVAYILVLLVLVVTSLVLLVGAWTAERRRSAVPGSVSP
jgi:hypothetical protein